MFQDVYVHFKTLENRCGNTSCRLKKKQNKKNQELPLWREGHPTATQTLWPAKAAHYYVFALVNKKKKKRKKIPSYATTLGLQLLASIKFLTIFAIH